MESVWCEMEEVIAKVPENFDFPFTPYSIQHEFMSKLYEVIENKQCGIFESPTGTVSRFLSEVASLLIRLCRGNP